MVESTVALGAAAILAAMMFGRNRTPGAAAAGRDTMAAPVGHRTGLHDDRAWCLTRIAGLLGTAPAEVFALSRERVLEVVQWILAHLSRETTTGENEFGWNPGNITPGRSWTGPVHRLRSRNGTWHLYRTFPDPAAGLADYWRLISGGRYLPGWRLLLAGNGPGWYRAILEAGYSSAADLDGAVHELQSCKTRNARLMGGVPGILQGMAGLATGDLARSFLQAAEQLPGWDAPASGEEPWLAFEGSTDVADDPATGGPGVPPGSAVA